MTRPRVHFVSFAHIGDVFERRWEEGCSRVLADFRNAVQWLRTNPRALVSQGEALYYQWVERFDPSLFREVKVLIAEKRWAVAGSWLAEPNLRAADTECVIRALVEGKRYFRDRFNVDPRVSLSLGSTLPRSLPQLLRRAGLVMHVHASLAGGDAPPESVPCRWRGADQSEVLLVRGALSATGEREAVVLGLPGSRWDDDARAAPCTLESLLATFGEAARGGDVVEEVLEPSSGGSGAAPRRPFTRSRESHSAVVQSEALRAAAWWAVGEPFPARDLEDAWSDLVTCEARAMASSSDEAIAEADDVHGKCLDTARRLRFGAVAGMRGGPVWDVAMPLTVLNACPSLTRAVVETAHPFENRFPGDGPWHVRVLRPDGEDVPCQEEPLDEGRGAQQRLKILADLPGVGSAVFRVELTRGPRTGAGPKAALRHAVHAESGLVCSIDAGEGRECLRGLLLEPAIFDAVGPAKGARPEIVARLAPVGPPRRVADGPVGATTRSTFAAGDQDVVIETTAFAAWPVIEVRARASARRPQGRLGLVVPTAFAGGTVSAGRRWLIFAGEAGGRAAALGLAASGAAAIDAAPEDAIIWLEGGARVVVAAGEPAFLRGFLPGLVDWLHAPPVAYAGLPAHVPPLRGTFELLAVEPPSVRMLALKPSWDKRALVVRVEETAGAPGEAVFRLSEPGVTAKIRLRAFEVKTLRFERTGEWKEVDMVTET